MQAFKEMVIKRPRVGRMPTIELQGKWLEALGFTVGTTVNVVFHDSCLTLSTKPLISNNSNVLQVTSKLVGKRPRTCLVVDWWLLRKYGFHVYDRIGLSLTPNTVQISKISRCATAKYECT